MQHCLGDQSTQRNVRPPLIAPRRGNRRHLNIVLPPKIASLLPDLPQQGHASVPAPAALTRAWECRRIELIGVSKQAIGLDNAMLSSIMILPGWWVAQNGNPSLEPSQPFWRNGQAPSGKGSADWQSG